MTDNSKLLYAKLEIPRLLHSYTLHAPDYYVNLLPMITPLAEINKLLEDSVWIQVFYDNRQTLEDEIALVRDKLSSNGQLWISWPKKSSRAKTDLTDEIVRGIGLKQGLVDVKVAAIDETWSALKFVYRAADRKPIV